MYKYIALCLCVGLCGVVGDLNLEEGAPCEWEGVRGQCVKETRCLTTLDPAFDKHAVCSIKDNVKIICCTDCQLVNDTRNVVMTHVGYQFKDGSKARDSCLEYIKTLPHKCTRRESTYFGIRARYDDKRKCHFSLNWLFERKVAPRLEPGADYPQQVVLGYGEELSTAWWSAGGTILSEKYILTAAFSGSEPPTRGPLTFVALDVKQLSDPPSSWQTHKVKRFIPYPEYRFPNFYHDIALIETETLITFNKNVLPACLPVVDMNTDDATALTWRDEPGLANEPMGIDLNKFTYEECNNIYVVGEYKQLEYGIDTNTQMCYGSRRREPEVCMSRVGEALLVWNQFCGCIPAVIGVTSFSLPCEDGIPVAPSAYTRVAYYIPWIESIVWP